jgi:hypothetical protein
MQTRLERERELATMYFAWFDVVIVRHWLISIKEVKEWQK